MGLPSALEISSESLVYISLIGSEDEELSLLEGFEPLDVLVLSMMRVLWK